LVGAYAIDLGDPEEKTSGYFTEPWDTDAIKSNQEWIIQFHSTDDPYIPDHEGQVVHQLLSTEMHQ
jgi:hypothetical protein